MSKVEIKVETFPSPRWWPGEVAREPMLFVSLPLRIRNARKRQLELVSAFLEGTEALMMPSPLVVRGSGDVLAFSGSRVRPVVAREGEKLIRRVYFMDSTGRRHDAGLAAFEPPLPCPPPLVETTCVFCRQLVASPDYVAVFGGHAHRKCIWPQPAATYEEPRYIPNYYQE